MKRIFLAAIGLLLIILLIWLVNSNEVVNSLSSISLKTLMVLLFLQIITILLINYQWYHLSKNLNLKLTFLKLLHVNTIGTFVESITPVVKAGGEAAKVYIISTKYKIPTGEVIALVTLQKIVSMLSFSVICLLSILLFYFIIAPKGFVSYLLLTSFGFLFILLFLFFSIIIGGRHINKIVTSLPIKTSYKTKIKEIIIEFQKTIKVTINNKKLIYKQILLSTCIWILFPVKAYLLNISFNIELPFITIAVITFLTYMIGMLPLLPGGLGTYEASVVMLLIPFGITTSTALAFALIFRFVTHWFVFALSAIYIIIYNFYKVIFTSKINVLENKTI